MFNLETGKIKLKPNEKKIVRFKKGKFKKTPVVNITTLGNNDYFLYSVNKLMFIIENSTNKNLVLHYTAAETNNNINISLPLPDIDANAQLSIITSDYEITFDSTDPELGTIEVNLSDYASAPEGESLSYTLVDDGSITDIEFYVSINNNILSLVNNQMMFLESNPVVFDVRVSLVRIPLITATITMSFTAT
jgi:hypothetical protein